MEHSIPADEVFLLMIVGISIMVFLSFAFVLFFYFSQTKLRNEQIKAQQLQLLHQEKLLYNNILTQEKERQRIAQDLHDAIGSKLNVINLGLHGLKKMLPATPMSIERFEEIFSVIHETIGTTRRISHDLLPPTLESFGLKAAIIELCEYYQKSDTQEVYLEILQDDSYKVEKIVELNLFRVFQELLNNSIRHGAASRISIVLWFNSQSIRLKYKDNGKGFDLNAPTYKPGLGMQNIESRLKMIQANYTFGATPKAGVQMDISVSC